MNIANEFETKIRLGYYWVLRDKIIDRVLEETLYSWAPHENFLSSPISRNITFVINNE